MVAGLKETLSWPDSGSKPRCSAYHAMSAFGSRDLKNTPPSPNAFAMVVSTQGGCVGK